MEVRENLSEISIHSTADIEQSLEEALRVISSWPTWKIASMIDINSEFPRELLDKFFECG